jgi:hypothetical protein
MEIESYVEMWVSIATLTEYGVTLGSMFSPLWGWPLVAVLGVVDGCGGKIMNGKSGSVDQRWK